jgi:hypothetical protein
MWKCPQLVCHDHLDVVSSSRITTFELELIFGKRKKSRGLRWGEYEGCRTTSFTEMAVWHGALSWCSIQVSAVWPDAMNPFYESFKDLTIVVFIDCFSLRYEFLKTKTLTVKKTNYHGFDIRFAHSCFLRAWWVACVRLRTLSLGFGIVFENPRFITCCNIFEKKFAIFDAFKKAHISSGFFVFVFFN